MLSPRRNFKTEIIILATTVYLSLASLAFCQDISVTSSVDKNVFAQDEATELTVTIEGNIKTAPEIQLPELVDFYVISSGQSQNISITGGQVNMKLLYEFLLVAKNTGKLQIPPVKVIFKGKEYSSQPIDVEVKPAKGKKELTPELPEKPVPPIQEGGKVTL